MLLACFRSRCVLFFFSGKDFVAQAGACLTSGMLEDYFCFIMILDRDIQTVFDCSAETSYPQ